MLLDMDSSKNEILIAVFLGIFIGFIAVLIFYFAFKKSQSVSTRKSVKSVVQISEKKTGNQNLISQNFDLTLDPSDSNIISQVSEFELRGTTDKNAVVVVQTDDEFIPVKLDSNGNFRTKINLTRDVTQVFITSVLDKTQEKTVEKIIYYNTKKK